MLVARKLGTSIFYVALFALSVTFSVGTALAQEAAQEEKVDLDELLQSAQADIGSEDFAAAAKKLKQITEAEDDNGTAWQLLGYALHLDGKIDEAIPAHEKAAKFAQFKQLGLYNLGCAYSLKEQPRKSLKFLHEALDAGFDRFEMFESDSDLENVKKSPGFKQIIARVKNDGKRPVKKFNAKSVVGEWTVTAGTRAGETVSDERLATSKITFDKDLISIPAGEEGFTMSYSINSDASPIQIDMKVESGPAPEGSAALGIIKMEKGKFVLCYNAMGGDRPDKFESTEENGNFLFTMKSDKKKTGKKSGKKDVIKDKPDEDSDKKDSDK